MSDDDRPTEGATEGIMRDKLAAYLHERQLMDEPLVMALSEKVRALEARNGLLDMAVRGEKERAEAAEARVKVLEAALTSWIAARDAVEVEATRPTPPAFSSAPMVALLKAEERARQALASASSGVARAEAGEGGLQSSDGTTPRPTSSSEEGHE